MAQIRQYIFTLICMAILCGLVPEFFENGSGYKKILKFTAGILMTIVAVTPLVGKDTWSFDLTHGDISIEAQETLSMGQEQADSMLRQIITQRTEAYILDKAASIGAELSVEVILTDEEPFVPASVVLTGATSPYVKKQLTNVLVLDLEISEDNLLWN